MGDEPIIAAMNATKTIPIIIPTGSDPLVRGFVASLTHPNGNVTGVSYMLHELKRKRLELLKEVISRFSRMALLWSPGNLNMEYVLRETVSQAESFKIRVQSLEVKGPADFEEAF